MVRWRRVYGALLLNIEHEREKTRGEKNKSFFFHPTFLPLSTQYISFHTYPAGNNILRTIITPLLFFSMSSLHIWFSKLKWSMDVLLRFYERHAFICGLHKETRLLFDELQFCLQRLYAIPFR